MEYKFPFKLFINSGSNQFVMLYNLTLKNYMFLLVVMKMDQTKRKYIYFRSGEGVFKFPSYGTR